MAVITQRRTKEERPPKCQKKNLPNKGCQKEKIEGVGYHALFAKKRTENQMQRRALVRRGWMNICVPLEQSSFFLQVLSGPKINAFWGRWGSDVVRACFALVSFFYLGLGGYTPCVMYNLQLHCRILHQGGT